MTNSRVDAVTVEAAGERLDAVLSPTPLQLNPRLSERVGGQVWLKREDLQVVRSYKVPHLAAGDLPVPSVAWGWLQPWLYTKARHHTRWATSIKPATAGTGRVSLPPSRPSADGLRLRRRRWELR
jgi:hypothetical protein